MSKKNVSQFKKIASISVYNYSTQYHYSNSDGEKQAIPEGADFFELEIDYSGCYYEGDQPSYIIHFYKKKA